MADQNNIRKCLEVVWNRKNSMHKSKYMLPKMKEINIDDSCKKKKSSKSQNYLQDSKTNENSKDHAHTFVKRSLFQENKNKRLGQKKLKKKHNKTHDSVQSLKKSSDGLSEASQIPCTKPQVITKRDKLKRKEGEPNDCVTTLRKNVNCLSDMPQISCTKSPQIKSNRDKLKRKAEEPSDCVTSLRQSSDRLSEVPQLSYPISPQIISIREKLKRKRGELNDYLTNLRQNSDNLSEVYQIPCTKSQDISNRDKIERKAEEPSDCVTSLKQSSDRLSEVPQLSYPISPQIISIREKLKRKRGELNDYLTNLRQNSDNLSEVYQIPCTKSQDISNRDKIERKAEEPSDCVISLKQSSDRLSEVPQLSYPISPQIISIREKLKRKRGELNDYLTNLRQNSDNLSEVSQIPCTQSQVISKRDKLKRKAEKPSECVTSLRQSSDRLSEVPQLSYPISPQIISIREKLKRKRGELNDYLTNLRQNSDNLSEVSQIPCTKSQVISMRDKLKRKAEEPSDCVISLRQSSDRLSEVPQISYPISPQIISIQEKLLRHGQNLVSKNVDKLNTPNSNEIKIDMEYTHKCVKKSLFQENKYKHCSLNKLNKRYSIPHDNVTNLRKTSDSLLEVSQISSTKSPQIISYKNKLTGKQINYIELKNIDKFNAPNNDDQIYMNSKFTQILNEKSENKNINSNEEQSKLSSVDFGDIIESSEVIYPFNKQKSNINDHIKDSHVDKSNISAEGNTEIKLQNNELKKDAEIPKSNCNEICSTTHVDCLDINLNTIKLESNKLKLKKNLIELKEDQNIFGSIPKMFKMDDNVITPFLNSKELVTKTIKGNVKTLKPNRKVHFSLSKDKSISFTSPSEVSIIPATPEHDVLVAEKPTVEYSPETHEGKYVPLIEVDQSPKTPLKKNCHALIQSDQSPSNINTILLPGIFETATSPPQSFKNSELPFNIDSVESPSIIFEDENCVSSEMCRKTSVDSPSPNHFDSAKKRKKCCKNGLRGKFQELINRKKSEACIREYEKNLSKNHHSKQNESAILNVVEAWKEFETYVLFCHHMKKGKEMEVQKVLVTLDNCPKNATKNSIIRIHSPWLTIESKTTETVLFIGVIHAEVIEYSVSNKSLGPTGLSTNNINGLQTTIFQNDILWKCNCSKDTACQCLGELSVYNYLQYMISH